MKDIQSVNMDPNVNSSSSASTKKVTKPRRKSKTSKETPTSDEDNPGCLGLLKKISCTLHCGGSSCSIKETEQMTSASSSSSPSEASSCESLNNTKKTKARTRKRRIDGKPPIIVASECDTTPEGTHAPPKKRIRRRSSTKKNVPEQTNE